MVGKCGSNEKWQWEDSYRFLKNMRKKWQWEDSYRFLKNMRKNKHRARLRVFQKD